MKTNYLGLILCSRHIFGAAVLIVLFLGNNSLAYDRYKDASGSGNCSTCHGDFTGNVSPKGTVFPSNSKHEMHRSSSNMSIACNLCHSLGDNRNPFLASSTGTANNPGLGCVGCHVGAGLRAHHEINGVSCLGCHDPETPPLESVKPPYYGTPDTLVKNPGNEIPAAKTNENWSVGDFIGLDNDGNNLYDAADFAIGPYRLLGLTREGNDLRVSWETAGSRRDVIQAAPAVTGPYTNIHAPILIPGIGIVTTNHLEAGGANGPTRFYRVKYAP